MALPRRKWWGAVKEGTAKLLSRYSCLCDLALVRLARKVNPIFLPNFIKIHHTLGVCVDPHALCRTHYLQRKVLQKIVLGFQRLSKTRVCPGMIKLVALAKHWPRQCETQLRFAGWMTQARSRRTSWLHACFFGILKNLRLLKFLFWRQRPG